MRTLCQKTGRAGSFSVIRGKCLTSPQPAALTAHARPLRASFLLLPLHFKLPTSTIRRILVTVIRLDTQCMLVFSCFNATWPPPLLPRWKWDFYELTVCLHVHTRPRNRGPSELDLIWLDQSLCHSPCFEEGLSVSNTDWSRICNSQLRIVRWYNCPVWVRASRSVISVSLLLLLL